MSKNRELLQESNNSSSIHYRDTYFYPLFYIDRSFHSRIINIVKYPLQSSIKQRVER